ncbi:hypothetical protein ACWD6L_22345 [Micromonospora profundi]
MVVISDDLDGSASMVVAELQSRGWAPQIIEGERLAQPSVSMEIITSASGPPSAVCTDAESGQRIVIGPDSRVFRRQPAVPTVEVRDEEYRAVAAYCTEQYRGMLESLFVIPCAWMNPASADRKLDQNKQYGNSVAQSVGISTIPTIITDSPASWRRHVRRLGGSGAIAVKPLRAWPVTLVEDPEAWVGIYTTRLSVAEALDFGESISFAPVILQPYIEKQYELRVTVVGREIFACRIDSQESETACTDWRRYDLANTPHTPYKLGVDLSDQILRFMALTGLVYAAFDFIVDLSGEPIFVEVNPCGQFGWIETLTGLPISRSIASWLLDATDGR